MTQISICSGQDLVPSEFARLLRELEPKNEKWKSIDWYPDLISGQRAAVENNKPLFIWAMDGHPLACT